MAVQTNGPASMYSLDPFYDLKEHIEFPTCMYKLQNIYGDSIAGDSDMPAELGKLERRQEQILLRLEQLSKEVENLVKGDQGQCRLTPVTSTVGGCVAGTASVPAEKLTGVIRDIVIGASPSQPPLSVLVLSHLLAQQHSILHQTHVHSSASGVSEQLRAAFGGSGDALARSTYKLAVTLIWKKVQHGPTLMVSPHNQTVIEGEACVARYLARLLTPCYEENIGQACEIDSWLDLSHQLTSGNKKEKAAVLKAMNGKLGQCCWLVGNEMSLADIVLWSAIQQQKDANNAPSNVKKWLQNCGNHPAFQIALKAL